MSVLPSTLHIRHFATRCWPLGLVLLSLLLLIGCDTPTPTQTPIATPTLAARAESSATATLLPEDTRDLIFEEVWGTVEREYLYEDFRGVDWLKLHDEYKPKALQANSVDEFYAAIKEMVEVLKDDHSRYFAPWEAREQDTFNSGNADYAGIGIVVIEEDNSELVEYVYTGSPAERAGLKRRDRITAVDGQPLVNVKTVSGGIRGPVGTPVKLTVLSPGQAPRDVTIVRQHITGAVTPTLLQLDTDPSIGYLIITTFWLEDMDKRVEEALLDFTNRLAKEGTTLKGLIIDVRGNEGGYGLPTHGVLGQFMEGKIGTTRHRSRTDEYSGDLDTRYVQRGRLFSRFEETPLVVLIDGDTQSNGEVFAVALQSKGRAKVVGTRSAGNTETVTPYNFRDGSRLWLAIAYFELWDGTNLEGLGVTPDVTIDVDWTSYTEIDDPHILEAVKIIQQATGN